MKAGYYVQSYIGGINELPHDLMLVSLGDAGLAQRSIDVRVTLTNRCATKPRRMGTQFDGYLTALPQLMESGQLQADESTSLVSFLRSVGPICAAGKSKIILFTDGINGRMRCKAEASLMGALICPCPTARSCRAAR